MTDLRERVPNIRALTTLLGADYSHIHSVLKGAQHPSVPLAKRIESATGGAIRWWEFFPESVSSPPNAAA